MSSWMELLEQTVALSSVFQRMWRYSKFILLCRTECSIGLVPITRQPSQTEKSGRDCKQSGLLTLLLIADLKIYAGAPLNEQVGKTLSRAGVRLAPAYGA